MVVWRAEPAAARALFLCYARLAAWLFGAVAVTGLISALLLVPLDDIATTSYGQVLLAKLILVLAVGALALAARRRLRSPKTGVSAPPRPCQDRHAGRGLRPVRHPHCAGRAHRPRPRTAPFAPPADGPTVPAGTRAGEIGISARASAGQLVLDLTTPQIGDTARASYALSATLADPHGATRRLGLRSCGTGCFYAPVAWRDGTSRLTLNASARQWAGGRAGLTLSWPPRPATGLLREAVTAMKKAPHFTLHELVTSNTTLGLGSPRELPSDRLPVPRLRAVRQRHRPHHHPPARRERTT
ncbi:CopD family protein [Streptomyces sp. NEAU-S77]|uniref:CopD family protein n=1 Tax=Streptomyces sp. NEAU-S77 TaxID=3411033 RepID=UPI003B9E14D5